MRTTSGRNASEKREISPAELLRPKKDQSLISSCSDPQESATYNALGAITTLTLPTGEVVTRTYLDGFLKKVEGQDRYATDLQYDVFGGLAHAALGNGDTLDFSFYPNGRLSGIQSNGGQAPNVAYSYDPSGNIASVTDALDPSASRSFTYDGLDRLTSATGPSTSETYSYSPAGNLLSKEGQPQLYTIPAHPHAVSDAIGLTMSYDAAGNLTAAGDYAYTYDEEGRMSEARQGGALNLSDNCPDVTNPAPTDTDAGNLGDACDAAPFNPDQDGDGLLDGDEVRTYHTDPANADTDGDGASDGVEVAQGFDPLDPASTPPLGGAVPALSAARGDRPGMLSRGSRRPA